MSLWQRLTTGPLICLLFLLTTNAYASNAASLERRHPARCPGHSFAVTAFDPQIEWVSESTYRFHVKVALQTCDSTSSRWQLYRSDGQSDDVILSFEHPWTLTPPQVQKALPTPAAIPLSGVSTTELRRWLREIYRPAGIELGHRPDSWNRTTLLRWLYHLLEQRSFPRPLNRSDQNLSLHLVSLQFDLDQILTSRDRQSLREQEMGLIKQGDLTFAFANGTKISYRVLLNIDEWGQVRVHHLKPLP
ncbi:MAG: hypothetical protein H6624_03090 [Bdellovibrionaceae bacterium]|nr:hypothetical protein [Bdellovibrionales bacterium]MCB9083299.1 hypothetical protein [Pseudobdellovibrionaceae bacterium]